MTSSAINFTATADQTLRRVMESFLDANNRLIAGPITVEELLVHVVRQPETVTLLASLGVRAKDLEDDALARLLEVRLAEFMDVQDLDDASDPAEQALLFPPRTTDFEVVIHRAIQAVQVRPDSSVGVLDLMGAMASLPISESGASHALHDHGLSHARLQALSRQQHRQVPLDALPPRPTRPLLPPSADSSPRAPVRTPLSDDSLFYDLRRPVGGWVDRQGLLEHAIQILACQRGPGLLLVGPSGVGKAALASELALRLHQEQAQDALPVLALDIQVLLANSQARGDLERQVLAKTRWLEKQAPGGVVLWVSHIGDVLQARRQGQDLIAPLRTALRRGVIRLMASATPEQAKQLQDLDPAFAQHFVPLRLQLPSEDEATQIVNLSLPRFEAHHRRTYAPGLVKEALATVMRHAPKVSPISPCLRALDEAGAIAARRQASQVQPEHVRLALALQFGLSPEKVLQSPGANLAAIERHLKATIVGQDHAIAALVQALQLSFTGLGSGGKTRPIGSFFFAGPTGVGKTALARQLAVGMDVPLLRFDMSEYVEPHTVSRLVGAPPGYVGYQDGGQLGVALTQNPRAVVLLDEFEKAAPQIHALFLQVLDHGFLTDGQGHAIDCRQAVFVFTSNVGAQEAERNAIGFVTASRDKDDRRDQALKHAFPPEFRNRFDHILQFNSLKSSDLLKVVDTLLAQLSRDAQERGHCLRFTPALRQWLAQAGYDPAMGARPLQRTVDREVTQALAQAMLAHAGPGAWTVGHAQGRVTVKRWVGRPA